MPAHLPERLPYLATEAARPYESMELPVAVLLDNVRSMYNVGSFFRTADAAGSEKLYLCGITAARPSARSLRLLSAPRRRSPGSTTPIQPRPRDNSASGAMRSRRSRPAS